MSPVTRNDALAFMVAALIVCVIAVLAGVFGPKPPDKKPSVQNVQNVQNAKKRPRGDINPGGGGGGAAATDVAIHDNAITSQHLAVNSSGQIAISNFPASFNVGNFPATQAVSSVQLPAALDANGFLKTHEQGTVDVSDRVARLMGHVNVDNFPATQPVSGTVSANDLPPTLTKGTQGATGFSTQDLKDAGRTPIVLSATNIVSVASEAMMTFQSWKAGTVTTGITSYTVTAGKTFRVQVIRWGVRFTTMSTTVTFANTTFRLRSGNLITSPLVLANNMAAASNVATPDSITSYTDGAEFPAGTVIGVSHAASAATLTEEFSITGYEY